MKANLVLSISFLTLLGSIGFPAASGQLSTNLDSNQEETSFSHINEHQYEVLASEFTLEEIQEIDKVSSEYEVWELTQAIEDPQQYIARKHSFFRAATNGCSFSPDRWGNANFKPACDSHDICYSSSSHADRSTCDRAFHASLTRICSLSYARGTAGRSACNGIANVYYNAVRKLGSSFYEGKGRND
ncbi:phospholipase A(2) [Arcanobacterium haemolyticum]|uniref:Phospholipase A2 n=1 Tax=Arcanobacterium haemolyticum (strain ATCC 9345 / DSM 20595 / CCM 5947 / CCUG 17215 / LMG 16163 / NBRC 15585 / NCTC 8452 / 11018) TaxID=644284 RepID=D7BN05_ARCHD|nr:phospholipase A(2) [Arcanobacterium haemolyticum]ADH92304.1 phospholipase A2 [Arcanobacterium haemolyticum DSM 20595]SQH28975.1 Prokaryotic phospholipase A2 [Arcanobacterium haemolyticum]